MRNIIRRLFVAVIGIWSTPKLSTLAPGASTLTDGFEEKALKNTRTPKFQ